MSSNTISKGRTKGGVTEGELQYVLDRRMRVLFPDAIDAIERFGQDEEFYTQTIEVQYDM